MGGPVLIHQITLENLLEAGFGASHPYTKTDPLCAKHMQSIFDQMAEEIEPGPHRATLRDFISTLDSPDGAKTA